MTLTTNLRTTTPMMRGYFAFPPPSTNSNSSSSAKSLFLSDTDPPAIDTPDQDHHARGQSAENVGFQRQLDEERRKRLERERALGESSEIEWVRAGGVLRDAFGRRDKTRTEQIRAELKLQALEKQKLDRWRAYEERWRFLISSTEPITFAQFPWPLQEPITDLERGIGRLKRVLVAEFLFESLEVRTNTTTRRERIRGSLLRWHPDKIFPLLSRVVPEDVESVREGIHVVFGILKGLQDAERTGSANCT